MSYFHQALQRLGIITVLTITPAFTVGTPLVSNALPPVKIASAPTIPFPLNGEAVYVLRQNSWQEALLTAYRWHSQTGFHYAVNYQNDDSKEERVPVDRIISLAEAQKRKIATNVYDLSSDRGITQIVDAHNSWRQKLGLKPLAWSPQLANFAQEWADQLLAKDQFEHRSQTRYGENLAAAEGQRLSPTKVVKLWGEEVSAYNYQTNTCKPGEMCGHYTQIVWHNTTEVGCATAKSKNKEVWVCNYNPPGNFRGQKPY
jgi:pathogenesis-related protein 1